MNLTKRSRLEEVNDVIIIGAGIAGLSAATELKSHGYDVIILEAKPWVGGRVHTYRSSDGALDLGASWICGTEGNPITGLARKYNAETTPTNETTSIVVYDDKGNRVAGNLRRKISHEWNLFVRFMEKGQKAAKVHASLQKAVGKFVHSQHLTGEALRDLSYELSWNVGAAYLGDPSELSDKYWDQIGYLLPGEQVIFPNGYDRIPNGLAEELDPFFVIKKSKEKIKTEHIVKKIECVETGVTVTTEDDNTFKGKYVICTLPLGVLQKKENEKYFVKFEPDLPPAKKEAIMRLKMGVLHKTYFIFEQPKNDKVFWDKDNDKDWINDISQKRAQKWNTFLNLYKTTKKPILLALNSGEFAIELETKTDDEVKTEGLEVLKKIYGDAVPSSAKIIRNKWKSDEFAGGSYSYTAVGANLADYDKLAEPVPTPDIKNKKYPKIFFAGEATTKYYPGTVHGAYISGIREANRLLYYDTYEKTHNIEISFPDPEKQLKNEWELFPEYIICKPGLELIAEKENVDGKLTFRPACVTPEEKKKKLDEKQKVWIDHLVSEP
jgi:monoamine oxidase